PSTVAGTPFQVPLTAHAAGGTDWLYTGTVHFTSSDPNAVLPADTAFGLNDLGNRSFTFTLSTPGNQTITEVAPVTGAIRGQVTVRVSPAGTTALAVTDFAPPASSGTAASFPVRAVDPRTGAVMAGYPGTVHFTSSDPQAVLPADY